MRCKQCEYPLWNLTPRPCPECGLAFKPSDFDLVPGAVRFLCPACGQQYFGTDERGHLDPAEFDCRACGTHIRMDEMALVPREGVSESGALVALLPWLDRRRIGFFRGWFTTIRLVMIRPFEAARRVRGTGQVRRALWFAIFSNFVFGFVGFAGLILPFMLLAVISSGRVPVAALFWMLASLALLMLVPMFAYALLISLWSVTAHVALRLTGPAPRSFRTTMVMLCYASGANALAGFPCIGPYLAVVSWIWPLVSGVIMLHVAQKVSVWRAMAAVLSFPILLAVGGGVLLWGYGPMMQQAMQRSTMPHSPIPSPAVQAASAVVDWAAADQGKPPAHGVLLIAGDRIPGTAFVQGGRVVAGDTHVGGVELTMVRALPEAEKEAAIEKVLSSMPDEVVAHRVGRIVFTYHGIDFSPDAIIDRRVWIVVISPGPQGAIEAVNLDLHTEQIPERDFMRALAKQNVIRRKSGLPPLPDLRSIRADAPAVAPPAVPAPPPDLP